MPAPLQTSHLLPWKNEEGHLGLFQPHILPHIPIALSWRDVLKGLGAVLTAQSVRQMLKEQGFFPRKGPGRRLQGDPQPMAEKTHVM